MFVVVLEYVSTAWEKFGEKLLGTGNLKIFCFNLSSISDLNYKISVRKKLYNEAIIELEKKEFVPTL
jgi:hypothetical protein